MNRAAATRPGPLLRVAHVWLDEVMADQIVSEPKPVTIGNAKSSMFTLPALGLPDDFAVIEPKSDLSGENVEYILKVKQTMTGRLKIDGKEMDVAEFLESGSGDGDRGIDGSFRSTRIASGDWGVIELDGQGEHNIFFQFVRDTPLPIARTWRDNELLVPALAFSMIMHLMLLAMAYQLHDGSGGYMFPGRQAIMTRYLIERPTPPVKGPSEESASKDGEKKNVKSATKGKKGKSGGEGKKERARDTEVSDVPPEIDVGLVSKESRTAIRKITENRAIDDKLQKSLARLQGNKRLGGLGSGSGTGIGKGDAKGGTGNTRGGKPGGAGGGGNAKGDFVSQGKIDTGETRSPKGKGGKGRAPKEVAVVGTGAATGNLGGLSRADIDKVIKSRKGLIRACYQAELNRTRGLGGKVVINFKIKASGKVGKVRVVSKSSTLRHKKIESCIMRHISRLKFPAKGGGVVNYPFLFSQR